MPKKTRSFPAEASSEKGKKASPVSGSRRRAAPPRKKSASRKISKPGSMPQVSATKAKTSRKRPARKGASRSTGRKVRASKSTGKKTAARKSARLPVPAKSGGKPAASKVSAAPARAAARSRKPAFPPKELERVRLQLLALRANRMGDKESREKEALKAAGQDVSVDHMADFGSDNYEQEFTLGLLELDVETLRDIGDALERLKEGSFGYCEECGKKVARARLRAIPYARLCVACKMLEE